MVIKIKKFGFWIFCTFSFFWLLYCIFPLFIVENLKVGEIRIVDRYGGEIAHLSQLDGFFQPLSEKFLPKKFIQKLLEIEDKRFYEHWGIDIFAKGRAIFQNFSAKKIVSGGSTITEQWIKNRYFRSHPRTFLQKLREATLAFFFSIRYSKDEILRNYLNLAYFGHQIYGLQSASYTFFQTSNLESLSDEQIFVLLTLLRSPSAATSNEAYFQKLYQKISGKNVKEKYKFQGFATKNIFPHVTSQVLQENTIIPFSSQKFTSSLDSTLQKYAQSLLIRQMKALEEKNATNGAILVFQPQTGEILVWVGSADFYNEKIAGQVNIILQKRQMGSALKPFLYLYAFLHGAHPQHFIFDLEKDFHEKKEDSFTYHPQNYNLYENGVVELKTALANSYNVPAIRLLEYFGVEKFYEFLQELGIHFDYSSSHYGKSLALGSADITMQEVAQAYGILANTGKKTPKMFLSKKSTEVLEFPENIEQKETAFFYLFDILSKMRNRASSFGLSSVLNTTFPFAVKTGTTSYFRDNWVFAYHPDAVIAVWVGNSDGSPMKDITGVTGSGPIFHGLAEEMIQKKYISHFVANPPKYLKKGIICNNRDCSQKEEFFQSDEKKWNSQPTQGIFCREDFFIQDFDEEDIKKTAQILRFTDFEIKECEDE